MLGERPAAGDALPVSRKDEEEQREEAPLPAEARHISPLLDFDRSSPAGRRRPSRLKVQAILQVSKEDEVKAEEEYVTMQFLDIPET